MIKEILEGDLKSNVAAFEKDVEQSQKVFSDLALALSEFKSAWYDKQRNSRKKGIQDLIKITSSLKAEIATHTKSVKKIKG